MPAHPPSHSSSSAPAPRPRRLGTIDQAAAQEHVTNRTIRNWAADRKFPYYRVKGVRGVLVDLDQVAAAATRYGRRYAGAQIIDLPEAVAVAQPQGSAR